MKTTGSAIVLALAGWLASNAMAVSDVRLVYALPTYEHRVFTDPATGERWMGIDAATKVMAHVSKPDNGRMPSKVAASYQFEQHWVDAELTLARNDGDHLVYTGAIPRICTALLRIRSDYANNVSVWDTTETGINPTWYWVAAYPTANGVTRGAVGGVVGLLSARLVRTPATVTATTPSLPGRPGITTTLPLPNYSDLSVEGEIVVEASGQPMTVGVAVQPNGRDVIQNTLASRDRVLPISVGDGRQSQVEVWKFKTSLGRVYDPLGLAGSCILDVFAFNSAVVVAPNQVILNADYVDSNFGVGYTLNGFRPSVQ